MDKVPFTGPGTASLVRNLYALSDQALFEEAQAIRENFREWLQNHYTLDDAQRRYLNTMDESFLQSAAAETARFVENRLPIVLQQQEPTDSGDEGKLIIFSVNEAQSYSQDTGILSSSTLVFTIKYGED